MAWLSGYGYRKKLTLNRASGEVSNYQMKMTGNYGIGTSASSSFYFGNRCQADFDDVRFTTDDGSTLIDYWLETKTDSSTASIWTEYNTISTSASAYYMYFGNPTATSASNGANTFIVFDDFERGSNGDAVGGSWTVVAGSAIISTEQKYGGTRGCKLVGSSTGTPTITIPITASDNIDISLMTYKEDAALVYPFFHGNGTSASGVSFTATEDISIYIGGTTAAYTDTTFNCTADAWKLLEENNYSWSGGTYDFWYDNVKLITSKALHTSTAYSNALRVLGATIAGQDLWIDNLKVRNYRATEPTWVSWGGEMEVNQIVTAGISKIAGVAIASVSKLMGVTKV